MSVAETAGQGQGPGRGRRFLIWLRRSWPQLVLALALSLLLWFLVVPDDIRALVGLGGLSAGSQAALVLSLSAVIAASGWRFCFAGRTYLSPRHIRYFAQSMFLTPMLFGLGVFVLLAYVPQMREIYLVLIDERRYLQATLGLAAILFLCLLLGCWQRSVGERLLGGLYSDHADLNFDRGLARVLAFKGNLASMLPLLGLVAGLFGLLLDASTQVARLDEVDALLGRQTEGDIHKVLQRLNGLVLALPFVTLPAAIMMWIVMHGMRKVVTAGPQVSRAILLAGGLVALVSIGLPQVLVEGTVDIARTAGPLAVVVVALIAIAAFFALMSWVSVRIKVPLTGLFLVVLGLVLVVPMFGGSTGSGRISRVPDPRIGPEQDLHDRFTRWLETRPSRESFVKSGKRYPVFVVAASGGGIYAASAAATFLAEMQDECSTFSEHVFAISGVSGGAVGASLFNALTTADKAARSGCARNTAVSLTDHTEQIVRADHLSPVVAVLISDIANKLVGKGETGNGDRADMLQRSFASAFAASAECRGSLVMQGCARLTAGQGMRVPFAQHWDPAGRAPALILNTTWSETGYRVAFAPFALHRNSDGTMYNFDEIAVRRQPPPTLIQAAVVSARFPGIVPAWPIDPNPNDRRNQRWNFVDGGYVDNSGATSALEIYAQLAKYEPPPVAASSLHQRKYPPFGMEIDLRLILLTDAVPDIELADIQGTGYSDTVAPLKALLQVRSQLANRAITQTINKIEGGAERQPLTALPSESKVWRVNLEQNVFPLPLGWMISRISNDIVGYMMGRSDLCPTQREIKGNPGKEVRRAVETVIENSCVKRQMLDLMRAAS